MLPTSLKSSLVTPAAAAIAQVLANGGSRTVKPRGEVSAVRTMTLDGFDKIAAAWSPILANHGYKLELQAVFCHSRPWVRFPRVPSPFAPAVPVPDAQCELADLLVVVDHRLPAPRQVERRAVLIQAKLLKGGSIRPSGKEWLQHELLAWLPSFQFVNGHYHPRPRSLAATPLVGDPALTAEYGSIELTLAEWLQWLPKTSRPCFTNVINLANFLAGTATGGRYCSREAIPGGNDDWSFTVDELLRVTAARPIVKSAPTILRGNGNTIGFIADTSALGGGGSGGGEGDLVEEWPEGPISTIHMIVSGFDVAALESDAVSPRE
jgi:hypothetical protein